MKDICKYAYLTVLMNLLITTLSYPPVVRDSKRISLRYQAFVLALQNKVVDLRMAGFPLSYCKDQPINSKIKM
jgi:hypothetical protein